MPLNDVWSIKMVARSGNQISINDLHYQVIDWQGTGVTATAVALVADNTLSVPMKPLITAAASWRGIIAAKVFPVPPQAPGLSSGNAGAGTGGATPLPAQVSGLITKLTQFSGRKFRGRVYVPFPATQDVGATDQVTSANYQARLGTLATALQALLLVGAAPNTATLAPCIFHRADGSTNLTFAMRVNAPWATQRRRGGYGRQNPVAPV